jgi:hypothetical protein
MTLGNTRANGVRSFAESDLEGLLAGLCCAGMHGKKSQR